MQPQQILAQPFTLTNGTVVKNRIVKSAMSEALGTIDNHPTAALETLYGRWSAGGTGLLITGNVMVDGRALGEPKNVVVEDERDLDMLKRWAAAGTRNGTQLWMQLNHPGKQSPKGLNRETVSPSAVPFREEMSKLFATPRELTDAEIQDIIHRFGTAAKIAKKAGFTGVQIHGAHGYLVSQFLSPHHNRRGDRWGGSAENRRRFALEVLAEMRRQVGPAFPIGIKLNSADFQRGGFSEDESLGTVRALADAGIDLIEISGGTYEAPAMTGVKGVRESTIQREAYFLEFAEKARQAVKTPLVVTGGFRSLGGMAQAITSGAIDFVGLARPLAIDPELPSRLLRGEEPLHQVRPISTGIKMVDKMAVMEVAWYARQLHRLGRGLEVRPNESGLKAFLCDVVLRNGVNSFRSQRTRASA